MLAVDLARLHTKYQLYADKSVVPQVIADENNILTWLRKEDEFAQLTSFYDRYITAYSANFQARSERAGFPNEGLARSIDLFYMGEEVRHSGKAKYLFVFEGSVSKSDKFSVTVLACLWAIRNLSEQHLAMRKQFWNAKFEYVKEKLAVSDVIARQCYVVDALRIPNTIGEGGDWARCANLLEEEVALLRPELIVAVGRRTAKRILELAPFRNYGGGICYVYFPAWHYGAATRKRAEASYKALRELYG